MGDNEADRKVVLFMHKGGVSARGISKQLEIPYSRVLRWIREESP